MTEEVKKAQEKEQQISVTPEPTNVHQSINEKIEALISDEDLLKTVISSIKGIRLFDLSLYGASESDILDELVANGYAYSDSDFDINNNFIVTNYCICYSGL